MRPRRLIIALVCQAIALLGAACSWEPTRQPSATGPQTTIALPTDRGIGQTVARTVESLVGVPYKWGGQSPGGFDCSGLVFYAYAREGVQLPRTAAQQMAATVPIGIEEARPGDLVFFRSDAKGGHVGVVIDKGRFVHAPSSGKRVAIGGLDNPYYRGQLIRVGRVFLRP